MAGSGARPSGVCQQLGREARRRRWGRWCRLESGVVVALGGDAVSQSLSNRYVGSAMASKGLKADPLVPFAGRRPAVWGLLDRSE